MGIFAVALIPAYVNVVIVHHVVVAAMDTIQWVRTGY